MLIQQTLEELEDEGVELLTAVERRGGARRRSQSLRPTLVFLDVMMPKLSGFDVCSRVKHGLGLQDVYIVLLTAKGQEFDRQKGQEVGADRLHDEAVRSRRAAAQGAGSAGALAPAIARAPMAALNLRQIIGRQPEAQALVAALATLTAQPRSPSRTPTASCCTATPPRLVRRASRSPPTAASLGWVAGHAQAAVVARLLEHLLGARRWSVAPSPPRSCNLYREVNLIYSFSEKLAALLDVERVARLTLEEARHLIAATDGAIVLHR